MGLHCGCDPGAPLRVAVPLVEIIHPWGKRAYDRRWFFGQLFGLGVFGMFSKFSDCGVSRDFVEAIVGACCMLFVMTSATAMPHRSPSKAITRVATDGRRFFSKKGKVEDG